jgi:nicotinamide-nucleotide amidase
MITLFPPPLLYDAHKLITLYQKEGWRLAVAESCTGGLVSGLFTSILGASQVFEGGFITYTHSAKETLLGLPKTLLETHGAVSEPVAKAMASATLERLPEAHIAISITGLAGPEGDSFGTPVGTVWFGYATRHGSVKAMRADFLDRTRDEVRYACLEEVLEILSVSLLKG